MLLVLTNLDIIFMGKYSTSNTRGLLKYFLGLKAAHSTKRFVISQCKYAFDILQETRMIAAKPASQTRTISWLVWQVRNYKSTFSNLKGVLKILLNLPLILSH
jgi:hypothetical protein